MPAPLMNRLAPHPTGMFTGAPIGMSRVRDCRRRSEPPAEDCRWAKTQKRGAHHLTFRSLR